MVLLISLVKNSIWVYIFLNLHYPYKNSLVSFYIFRGHLYFFFYWSNSFHNTKEWKTNSSFSDRGKYKVCLILSTFPWYTYLLSDMLGVGGKNIVFGWRGMRSGGEDSLPSKCTGSQLVWKVNFESISLIKPLCLMSYQPFHAISKELPVKISSRKMITWACRFHTI